MNKKEIALIIIVLLLSIVLVIGGTYAFYTASITGDGEDITIASGYLELTFDEGGSNINIEGALPTSKGSKTFTVTNTSTANSPFTYNIKLSEIEVTFEQKDLVYELQEYTDGNYDAPKGEPATGYINADTVNENGEMYLAINIDAPAKDAKHYYKLTIEFKETNENQNYNFGKLFTGKINGDDNRDAALYKPSSLLEICNNGEPLNECLAKGEQLKNIYADDPGQNIRYAGPSAEVNNYIWFNCNDYEGLTKDNATEKGCEKW